MQIYTVKMKNKKACASFQNHFKHKSNMKRILKINYYKYFIIVVRINDEVNLCQFMVSALLKTSYFYSIIPTVSKITHLTCVSSCELD